jgi:hypothetical protein
MMSSVKICFRSIIIKLLGITGRVLGRINGCRFVFHRFRHLMPFDLLYADKLKAPCPVITYRDDQAWRIGLIMALLRSVVPVEISLALHVACVHDAHLDMEHH